VISYAKNAAVLPFFDCMLFLITIVHGRKPVFQWYHHVNDVWLLFATDWLRGYIVNQANSKYLTGYL
jgi:hypothetical protein